jgi:hypothetical protein
MPHVAGWVKYRRGGGISCAIVEGTLCCRSDDSDELSRR